jgi:hypothetical protein
MILELLLEILGYGIIVCVLAAIAYAFIKLLSIGLDALSNNDD